MAQRRRGERGSSSIIWPGFVDAMTALLLVLMFVLSIFLIVQFVLREELTGKDETLQELNIELGFLRDQLGISQARVATLEGELETERASALALADALAEAQLEGEALRGELADRVAELSALTSAFEQRGVEIDELQAIAAALRDERDEAVAAVQTLEDQSDQITALADENAEIRAALAVAREEAAATQLTLEERIAALELAVEERSREAEETLALLAAAELKSREISEEALAAAAELDQREAALAYAMAALQSQEALSAQGREAVALLNAQVLTLRRRIEELTALLDVAEETDAAQRAEIELLGARLNQALAAKVDELADYRSEFFGRLREILGDRDDVQIVGDRFVFRSEVLFESGSAELSPAGQRELARFADALRTIAPEIPPEINWILRIDGHTDRVPLGPNADYEDNWELSQARALSVVQYLIVFESIPPERLAAAGFSEYQPIDPGSSEAAFARNRRIELRFDER